MERRKSLVHVRAESAFHGLQIGFVAVAGELNAVSKTAAQIVHKPHGAITVATADEIRNDQLAICVNGGPGPGVASAVRRSLSILDILLFGVGEAPNLIDLYSSMIRDGVYTSA